MTITPLAVPGVPFGRVQGRIARLCDPFERNAQIAVYGITGSGKTHMMRYGILPLRENDRTVVIDMKDDRGSIWSGFGRAVDELPPAFFKSGDGSCRWRVIVDRSRAKAQLGRVLDQIRDEGHCVVVIDDTRPITEREQAGLSSKVEDLITVGRELGISMVMGAQSTAYAVPSLKDQPAALFIGQCSGTNQAMKLAKLAGYGRDLALTIGTIEARQWLYRDLWEGPPILALTALDSVAGAG